jgi:hypothetical protein
MPNVDYTILIDRLQTSGITFPFMFGITPTMLAPTATNINASPYTRYSGATVDQWFQSAGFISGFTNDKLNTVKSYNAQDLYIPYLVINSENYTNYLTTPIASGVTMVFQDAEPITYVVDAAAFTPLDLAIIGTDAQTTGLKYDTYATEFYSIINLDNSQTIKPKTTVRYVGEGWNDTNVGLSAMTKSEYLFGIVSPPQVFSDVQIDRGVITVMEKHLRLGEIKGLNALREYGNGFYKLSL